MNPKTTALAFRIWQYAHPREWNVTLRETADALGVSWFAVRNVAARRGWTNRFRVLSQDHAGEGSGSHSSGATRSFDADLEGEGVRGYLRRDYGGLTASLD